MKMILLIAVTVAIFLFGCNGSSDQVRPFIPGTYLATWRTAFSTAVDTMSITAVAEGFLIVRRTHVQFINAAKTRAPEYSISKWQGVYNAGDQTVVVPVTGRVISFDPGNKTMRLGITVYKKL